MDDKRNPEENQSQSNINEPQPIFESVNEGQENIQTEEVPEEMNVAPETPPEEPPPIYEENKNKYLLVIGGVVIFLIFFIFVFRLLIGGSKPPKQVKLVYWGLWEDQQVLDPLIKDYQRQNKNIEIQYEKMTPQDYLQKLIVRSKEGRGPDIFRFHNTWVPELKEIIAPLPEKIMTSSEFDKTFYPVHQKDLKIGKYYYGIPLEIDGLVLIINEDIFKKAGIAAMPANWDELLDDIGKITTKDTTGQIITSGIALGTSSNLEHYSDIFGWMLIQNGGDLKKLEEKEAIEILKSFRGFAEAPNNFWDENMSNSINAFTQEKVAMLFAPSWQILSIKAKNPDIKIKSIPLPKVPGTKQVSIASYWVEGVSKFSQNQLEAWKFLKFLAEKENMTKLYENEAKTRLFGEPYSRVDLGSLLIQNEYIGAVIEQANSYQTLPMVSKTFDNGLNDEIIKYIENAINATANGVAYDQAMRTASEGVNQILNKYKIE